MNEPKDYEYLLLCDGSTISEENYPELVAVLGGTHLPNLIDRFLQGSATAGMYKAAGLPDITGYIGAHENSNFEMFAGDLFNTGGCFKNGVVYSVSYTLASANSMKNNATQLSFVASRSNSIYGNSTTVQPPAYTAKIYICYAG